MNRPKRNHELSALIDADSFFYAITDRSGTVMDHGTVDLADIPQEIHDQDSENCFDKAKFGLVNTFFSLVPVDEFEVKKSVDYVVSECNVPDQKSYLFRNDLVSKHGIRVVYAVKQNTIKLINQHFVSPSMVHFISAILEDVDVNTPNKDLVKAVILKNEMAVVVCKARKLYLANIYACPETTDYLYYTSLIYLRLGFDRTSIPLYLSGEISGLKDDDIYRQISLFFGNINFDCSTFDMSKTDELESQLFYPLSSISQCA